MEWIQSLLDSSTIPMLTAFLLGILTAISPCPLATNITAVGYISKNIESRRRIFWGGLLYTLGRVVAYTVLGIVLISILREGASIFAIQKTIAHYGEMFISPILILIGLFMLYAGKLNLPKFGYRGNGVKTGNGWGAFLLGVLFALSFCPTSAVFYFGMLIPMATTESEGVLLPILFAIATGLPVIIVSWVLAFSFNSLGKFYNQMKIFQKWFSIVVALLFIAAGIYYGLIFYF